MGADETDQGHLDADGMKRVTGRRATNLVEDGMRVGIGTGSTVRYTIEALADRQLDIVCVPTSVETDRLGRRLGLRITDPDAVPSLDIDIDGADEVDPRLNLIKGGGGAHFRERLVAEMADRFVVIVDETKLVDRLGAFGVPVEVMDFGQDVVARRLRAEGAGEVLVRPTTSDNGNLILDADFGLLDDPNELAGRLTPITGVIAHGLFPGSMVSEVMVAKGDGSIETLTHD